MISEQSCDTEDWSNDVDELVSIGTVLEKCSITSLAHQKWK